MIHQPNDIQARIVSSWSVYFPPLKSHRGISALSQFCCFYPTQYNPLQVLQQIQKDHIGTDVTL